MLYFNYQSYFKEFKRQILYYIYHLKKLWDCFFINNASNFLWYHFHSVWIISFSNSFTACLLEISSLNFSSLENVLISPSFLKDVFIGCGILGWQIFSSRTLKMLFYFLLIAMVFKWEIQSRSSWNHRSPGQRGKFLFLSV